MLSIALLLSSVSPSLLAHLEHLYTQNQKHILFLHHHKGLKLAFCKGKKVSSSMLESQ